MSLKPHPRPAALTLIAGLAALPGAASAQDSVSNNFGFPGDAVSPYSLSEQVNDYVVDMAPLTGSWGTKFGVAPLVKLSGVGNNFYTGLGSGYALSNTVKTSAPFARDSYALWSQPGAGVNAAENNAPGSIGTANASGVQFGLVTAEFDTGYGGLIGAIVNYDPADPSRLFVTRVQSAINGPALNVVNAALGVGGVDSDGNIAFRADNFGGNGGDIITGNNYFRVDALARSDGALNTIGASGPGDPSATTWLDLDSGVDGNGSATTHTTPTVIPESLAGRPVVIGANFNNEYVYESSAGETSTTTSNRDPLLLNTRGTASFSSARVFNGAVGAAAMYSSNGAGFADRLILWGVDATGGVTGTRDLLIPASITDNDDGFSSLSQGPFEEFGNFRSQVAFNGGNGPVAVGQDQAGNTLVAANAAIARCWIGAKNPTSTIAVARIDAGGIVAWTLAGYVSDGFSPGKEILDGPGGQAIGRLCEMYLVTGAVPPGCGQTPPDNFGPSISSPMIDSVGNLYFVSAVEIFGDQGSDFDTALIRAVYDPATFSYQLERVFSVGYVFSGANSGTDYQVRFLELVDNNSIASAAPFSGSIIQAAAHGQDPSGLDPADPRTLGGIALSARIVYDTSGDGDFDPSVDENYRAIMYIGDTTPAGDECYADCDENNTLDFFDFLCYLNAFDDQSPYADCEANGIFDFFDFLCYLNEFNDGC